jgi:hypothetical protein
MAAMAELGIKINGEWHNVTIGINDETNEWGKNINVWKSQTKEEREAKADKEFCGNGKVFWNNGTVKTAERKEQPQEANDGMPF